MSSKTIIKLDNVNFSFGAEPALDHISLQVEKGDYVGVIGPNGGGKTTLLKAVLGLVKPHSGTVELFGEPIQSFRDWWKIGYVPQNATHFDSLVPITVEEVAALGRVSRVGLWHRFTRVDKQAVADALDHVGMLPLRKSVLTQLSGGQQQRVFLAKALVSSPEVLILDEPTVGVDAKSQDDFYQLLSRLNREEHLTLLLVSHDIDVVVNEVNVLACINESLVYHGHPHDFIKGDYLENLYGKGRKLIIHH